MMKEITQEKAGKYAKACGCKYIKKELAYQSGLYLGDELIAHSMMGGVEKKIPTDPYFWFGRLWDRLDEKAKTQYCEWNLGHNYHTGHFVGVEVMHNILPDAVEHPCDALYETIKELTERLKDDKS